jgi:LDH2 family malate/lactate/ureidoglycolate dehydrogenase
MGEEFCAGKLDILLEILGHPAAFYNKMIEQCGGALYNFSKEEIDGLTKILPFSAPQKIKGGMYYDTPNDINTFGFQAVMIASSKVHPKSILHMMNSAFGNLDKLHKIHPALSTTNRGSMKQDLVTPRRNVMNNNSADGDIKRYPIETVRTQIENCLTAWGMTEANAKLTSEVMVDADTCGIDTHGISMLTVYHGRHRNNYITLAAEPITVNETPVSALIDAGGGLGYVASIKATETAIAKAQQAGMAAVAVRNSAHFGATGYYTRMMARKGLVGIATTSAVGRSVAPTFGKEPKFGTDPIAFAAPTKRNKIYSLDMATTTVARGKIRNKYNEGQPVPVGWVNDKDGNPTTDPALLIDDQGGTQTPLGGTRESGSHKGYGLGMMVNILSCAFSGARIMTGELANKQPVPGTMDVGHFFLAIDPKIFAPDRPFEEAVDEMIDDLHATIPVDPNQPVLVAGEPEDIIRAEREKSGIPIPPGLRGKIEEVCRDSNAEFLLT